MSNVHKCGILFAHWYIGNVISGSGCESEVCVGGLEEGCMFWGKGTCVPFTQTPFSVMEQAKKVHCC